MPTIIRELALAISLLTQEQNTSIDPEELVCMVRTIHFEAADQSREGRVAVAQVVMNRVHSPYYPNTVCEVVKQPAQFSWYWDGKSDDPKHWPSYYDSMLTGFLVMADLLPDQVKGATHYFAHNLVTPVWAARMKTTTIIDGHTFKI